MVVDDILMASNNVKLLNEVVESMQSKYRVKDLGKPSYIIGMHIDYDEKGQVLKLDQKLYLKTSAEKFGIEKSRPVGTPADKGSHLKDDMGGKRTKKDYRGFVGTLIYATHTRPDVSTIVSSLSRYNDKTEDLHYEAAVRVLRYVYHSRRKSLVFKPKISPGEELEVYSDSSWNSDPDTSRSRSGYLATFNKCQVSWKSGLQKVVALSSCEAEYIAACEAAKEAIWLKHLLEELKFPQKKVVIYVDNQSAIKLAQHSMIRPRTKHIKMRFHCLRNQVSAKW